MIYAVIKLWSAVWLCHLLISLWAGKVVFERNHQAHHIYYAES